MDTDCILQSDYGIYQLFIILVINTNILLRYLSILDYIV
jgi:hypothetical protein